MYCIYDLSPLIHSNTFLSQGATRASYKVEGQATDEIVTTRLKKKMGNNAYTHKRQSQSPATPKGRAKKND